MKSMIPRTLALAAMTLAATEALPQQRGSCVSVAVPFPIVLPDGGAYDSGTLRICLQDRLSPVSVVHAISVNGHAVGLYLSRPDRAESSDLDQPVIAFVREQTGALRLSGYVWPDSGRDRTHRFAPDSTSLDDAGAIVRSGRGPEDDGAPVLLAARRN